MATGILTQSLERMGDFFQEHKSEHGEKIRKTQGDILDNVLNFLEDIGTVSPDEVIRERQAIEKRLNEANFKEFINMIAAHSGDQGAQQLRAGLADYNAKLQYALDELNTNPTRYLAHKRAQLQEALYTGTHLGQLFASMPDTDIHGMQIKNEFAAVISQLLLADIMDKQRSAGMQDDPYSMIHGFSELYDQLKRIGVSNRNLRPLRGLIEQALESFTGGGPASGITGRERDVVSQQFTK